MNKILKLSQDVINQIAAGEVVERPSSVVKELVENAIDAGATEISIELIEGGAERIKITDNGSGMSAEDACEALKPHTTSKLHSIDDLLSLRSLGFRGEALASISSVSKFTLETMLPQAIAGFKISIDESGSKESTVSGRPGTMITVDNLFYNVPARRKFLKKVETEYLHILDLISGLAVHHFQIAWRVIHNNHTALQLPAVSSQLERIKQVLGLNVTKDLLPIKEVGEISIRGFLGAPLLAKQSKSQQFFYVNGRRVIDAAASRAVTQAFGHLLSDKSHPVFILNLDIPPALVDINVHPRKTEVRFQNPNEVFMLIGNAVRNCLTQHNLLNGASIEPVKEPSVHYSGYAPVDRLGLVFKPSQSLPRVQASPAQSVGAILQTLKFAEKISRAGTINLTQEILDDWKLIGQIHRSYLIVETKNGFMVLDQHAAAERLNYESLKSQLAGNNHLSQPLLAPLTIELSLPEAELVRQFAASFNSIGFEFEFYGDQTMALTAVPNLVAKTDLKMAIHGIIADLLEEKDHFHNFEEQQEIAMKYTACRGAIMFQDSLTPEEQLQLLADIKNLSPEKYTCAHGRPILKEFKKEDLEKLFHRR